MLGPNGAGKSTTVRMLACYLPPTSGRAEVAGCDVFRDSFERGSISATCRSTSRCRTTCGSTNISHRAALKGVPGRRIKERLADVSDLCGLGEVERKMIATLSKGFRQRVGLADAMIHEPELLILDEPTIGLDPNQIRQVRELIKNCAVTIRFSFQPTSFRKWR